MARPTAKAKQSISPDQIPIPPRGVKFTHESPEPPKELAARLRREADEATHRLWRESILFGVGLIAVVAMGCLCAWVAFLSGHGAEEKKWAAGALGTILGYLVRGKDSKGGAA